MNRDNVRLWVDALRSGLYEQTKSMLNNDGKYCCLGVACEVAIANGVEVDKTVRKDAGGSYTTYGGESASLPQEVAEWLGNDRCCPEGTPGQYGTCELLRDTVRVHGGTVAVITLNDAMGWTFEQIADVLEQEYLRD